MGLFVAEAVEILFPHDDVVEERDVQHPAGIHEFPRKLDVGSARSGDPGRMVVRHDDGGGIVQQGLAQDSPAIDARLLQGAFRNHLLADKDASGK